ncbi:hypothetical protein AVEN_170567-1 [Araneus ventricosus]|uniref:Uncharacterized protein n=1 Tax=Araneus ventricosus TaxID=182803 RepID=A0A4Y2SMG3_ARAVE|nr:hypothetical protein AVEN_170567-1 [Araneus ventricosus]
MNINKSQLMYVNSLPSFNNLIADSTKNIKDVYLPTPEVAVIVWDSKKDFIPQDTGTNIFLAAFTTAWARLELYSEMDKLGEAVLNHGTDSIIYASNGGHKNYAYRTSQGKRCCKVRGFTLNFKNNQTLNFESIKHLVCSLDRNATIPLNDAANITRDAKRRKVFNVQQTKLYRIVYDKRVNKEDFSTIPYRLLK